MSRKVLLLTLIAAATSTVSCVPTSGAATAKQESGTAAVRATLESFFEAALRRDWDATAPLMSADFVMFADGAQMFNRNEYLRLLKSDDIRITHYKLRDVSAGVSDSGDLAWMTYKGYFEQVLQGKPGRVETAETLLFRNENGNWRMFRAQASVRNLDAR